MLTPMTRLLCNGGAALVLLVSIAGLLGPSDEGHGEKKAAPGDALPAHSRAPIGVKLTVDQPDKQVAWIKDIERKAAAEPGRFSKSEDHWVDSRGEYEWDEENECYWQNVSAETLTRGRQEYVQFCASCHGFDGDGLGRSGQSLRPPPRDFRQATFKFTKVYGDLPNDEALIKLLAHGLDGTPMLPWSVATEPGGERVRDILAYIKSLAPAETGWHDGTLVIGDVVHTPPDPWAGKEKDAIKSGEKAYHQRQCWTCHPSYLGEKALNEARGSEAGTTYDATLTWSKLKTGSSYEVNGYKVAILAPDFTWNTLRYSSNATETFQTIAAGIPGAGMPTWGHRDEKDKGAVPDEEIWAIAHYVRHLVDTYKDKPRERAAFMAGVRAQ
jgi:mono/diheme cytochrome c family protein